MYNDNYNHKYDGNNNKNQFCLGLSNVKCDD